MIELAISRSDRVDEVTIDRLRAALPATRRLKSDRYYRQVDRETSILSFALLQLLWTERHGWPVPEVVLGVFGKPAFAGVTDAHFNISHDGSVCACVFAPVPVGVDVQSRVPFDDDLFDRISSVSERRLRDRLVAADDLSALWTRKEALVKRTGRGLTWPLPTIEALSAPDVLTLTCDEPDVRFSVSAEGLTAQELLAGTRIRFVQPDTDPDHWSTIGGDGRLQPCLDLGGELTSS